MVDLGLRTLKISPVGIIEGFDIFGCRFFFSMRSQHDASAAKPQVGSEENAFFMADEKVANLFWWMTTKLRDTGRRIDQHVGIGLEPGVDGVQIFRIIAEMDADKGGFWVSLDYTIPFGEEGLPAWT